MSYPVCYSKVVRKAVARVLTVISQEQKKALREAYKNKVMNTAPAHAIQGAFVLHMFYRALLSDAPAEADLSRQHTSAHICPDVSMHLLW